MTNPFLVDATDLAQWANRLDARAKLPQLIRQLILATADRVDALECRAGEGVQFDGWDGIAHIHGGNAFLPEGISGWEMGTDTNIKGKADNDYEKRTKDPLSLNPAHTNFIFVTPRRWKTKRKWAEERRQDKIWKDVRAYDADDLAAWLEQARSVDIWISIVVGKRPPGLIDFLSFWQGWSEVTRPALSANLVIAGRGDAVIEVQKWFRSDPTAVGLQAETIEEALAFFVAVLFQSPEEERQRILARGIVVKDPDSWAFITSSQRPLILAPIFADRSNVVHAATAGHHVIIPMARSDTVARGTVQLPRLSREDAKTALEGMGLGPQASELGSLARRSLGALRRKLAINPALLSPKWATPEFARSLLPAVLAAPWNDQNNADREAVSCIVDRPYSDLREDFIRWSNESDPPLRLVRDTWLVSSKEDAWSLLSRYVTPDDLVRFEVALLDVLGEPDPRYDLPVGERWTATIKNKVPKYSELLRRGMAETVALLAAYSDACSLADSSPGQEWANRIVYRLFERVKDWQTWASLTPHILRLLAEAAPETFLVAVERGLSGADPFLVKLFTDGQSNFMEGSPHTGLLWALEVVAWSPDYLSQASVALAKLARLDPGGKLGNRPIESLRQIFCCWHPSTTANLEQRLRILDTIRKRESEVSWSLLVGLLPNKSRIASYTAEPNWRPWVPEEKRAATYSEFYRAIKEIVQRLLEQVGTDGTRWQHLVEALDSLPRAEFDAILDRLLAIDLNSLTSDDRLQIWDRLRRLISHHLEYPEAEWVLPSEIIERLQQAYKRLEPDDPLTKRQWLFSNDPALPEAGYSGYQERQDAIAQARIKAVEELFELGGLLKILELADQCLHPWYVGIAMGEATVSAGNEEPLLDQTLGSAKQSRREVALGFLRSRPSIGGPGWLESVRSIKTWQNWNPRQRADYFLSLSFSSSTWDALEAEDGKTRELYWREVGIFGRGDMTLEDRERSLANLMQYKRLASAIRFLNLCDRKKMPLSPERVAEVLEQTAQGKNDESIDWSSVAHDVGDLLDFLEESAGVDALRIARIEWFFLPLLKDYVRPAKVLNKALANDPKFFVEVLNWVYRAEGEEPRELTEEERSRAEVASDLLTHWSQPPGLKEDGTIDTQTLRVWVEQTREVAAAKGHAKIADSRIGEVLSRLPKGQDGAWPHEILRDLIEEVGSEELERGISRGIYNKRGVVHKSLGEGGIQELAIAQQYREAVGILRDKWPRTARLINMIAQGYESDSRSEDVRAELQEALRL